MPDQGISLFVRFDKFYLGGEVLLHRGLRDENWIEHYRQTFHLLFPEDARRLTGWIYTGEPLFDSACPQFAVRTMFLRENRAFKRDVDFVNWVRSLDDFSRQHAQMANVKASEFGMVTEKNWRTTN